MNNENSAIGFTRVASKIQKNTRSESLQIQREKILAFANEQKLEIVGMFEHSGNTPKELRNAFNFCKQNPGIKKLIVSSVDRLGRNLNEIAFWQATFKTIGVEIVTPRKKMPEDIFMEMILVEFARYEQEMRSKRMKERNQNKAIAKK